MKTQAAILVAPHHLVIDEIELPALQPGQVLVKIAYSGICHTQLLEVRGYRGHDPYLPHCLGHEGSGIVVEVGEGVTKVKPGDAVILSWMKGQGANVMGSIFNWQGKKVNAGAITTFSQHSIISENRLTPIPSAFPLKTAALMGCALPTGLGAVLNTAQPKPGSTLAVFGCGGIGLCAIKGAQIAGCSSIIAIDLLPAKLEAAVAMGATHCICAAEQDPLEALKKLGPLDFAIEASGHPTAMQQALAAVRPQGGTAVIVGNARQGQTLTLDPKEFNQGKRLLGTWGGDNQPDVHFPQYCDLVQNNRLNVSSLTSKVYALHQIEEALQHLETGLVLRPLVDMSLPCA